MSIKDILPFEVSTMYSHLTPKTLIITPSFIDCINLIQEMVFHDPISKPIKFFLPDRFKNYSYLHPNRWKDTEFNFYPIHEKYDWTYIKNIIKDQQDYYYQHLKFNYLHLVLEIMPREMKALTFIDLMMNARNLGIQVTLILKQSLSIVPSIRSLFDYAFLDWFNQTLVQKQMYQYYTSFIPSQKRMEQLLLDAYQHNCLLVINYRSYSNRIEDKISMYLKI